MASNSLAPPRSSQNSIRRVSSHDIDASALDTRRPSVVVPPGHLTTSSDAHETAAAMEMARYAVEEYSTPLSPPETPSETTVTDKYAYAFDIDGVLIRGGKPIPEAIEAMKVLNGQNAYGIKM